MKLGVNDLLRRGKVDRYLSFMTIKTYFKCNINHKYHKYGSINLGNIGQSKRIREIYIDDHHVYKE